MNIASRTPEGEPHLCPICGELAATEPSEPLGDSTCPRCGSWLRAIKDGLNLRELSLDDTVSKLGDSLDVVELAMELEEEFHIDLSDDLDGIETIADLIRLIRRRMQERGDQGAP